MFPELLEDHDDQSAANDSSFITPDTVEQISTKLGSWKSFNTESLGQLWLSLFKYVGCFPHTYIHTYILA